MLFEVRNVSLIALLKVHLTNIDQLVIVLSRLLEKLALGEKRERDYMYVTYSS